MATQCTSDAFPLAGLGRRQVVAKFDGGRLSSDGGAVLLRAANQAFQVTGRLAACFIDHRNPARVEHSLESLLGQRVFALALGYEDINDHDRLRDDSLLALALDGPDLTGQSRRRERDRGHALAGSSTLNRLELGTLLEADEDRYKKVVASTEQIDDLLVDLFLDMHETLPERIVLDVDATDDQLHGQQEGRFYHGYYRHYCYLPLYITCGEHVLCARLRTAQAEAAEGTVAELERIVRRIRQRWPQAAIVVRGDAGFCRDTLMTWCEQRGVDYVLGLARNSRLLGQIRRLEYLRSFGLFGLWQLWQSSGPGGRVHFMIAEKSSDVKVKRVSRLTESKARCCISHDFGGFYQIIPCIRPAVVRIKSAHGCPATIRIFVLGRAVQTWQREPGGRPMPPAMEAKGARSTIRERGSRGQSLSPLRLSSKCVGGMGLVWRRCRGAGGRVPLPPGTFVVSCPTGRGRADSLPQAQYCVSCCSACAPARPCN